MDVIRTAAWTWAFAASALAAPQAEPQTIQAAQASPVPLPQPALGPANGGEDPAAAAQEAAKLAETAEKAESPLGKAGGFLAAANVILARQVEPLCTDRFYGIERESGEGRIADADRGLAMAEKLIEQGRAALQAVAEGNPADPALADRKTELAGHADTLSAFAGALIAYLEIPRPGENRSPRRAASDLSPMMEDANGHVAAAATFWHACLRSMDPEPDAALSALEPIPNDLPAEGARYAFFGRLLRARLLARRGAEAAATALLMQAEERVNNWFKPEAERFDALRAIALIQMQVLQSWYNRLPEAQTEERAWCAARSARLLEEWLGTSSPATVLRLRHAVPIIVEPPPASPPPDTPGGTP